MKSMNTHEPTGTPLSTKLREVHARGLMSYPAIAADEAEGIRVLERILPLLREPLKIRHPHQDLELSLPALLGPRMIYLIAVGDYEQTDLELILRYVRDGDTVLELGGGAGVTTALFAKRTRRSVTLVEPDVRLFPLIAEQVRLNGGSIELIQGCLSPAADGDSVPFLIAEAPWFSSLFAESQPETPKREVLVPVIRLPELLEQRRPSVLFVDIEGAEQNLFDIRPAWLPRLIMIEIHYPLLGPQKSACVVQQLTRLGYQLLELHGWTHVFEHEPSR
jgi:FkbM family methyltransferase